MTEQEWLSCSDPQKMLESLRSSGKLSERKLRLFGAACCRTIWHLMLDSRSRRGVEVAELLADGLVTVEDALACGNEAAEVQPEDTPDLHEEIAWRVGNAAASLLPRPQDSWQLEVAWQYVSTALEGFFLTEAGMAPDIVDVFLTEDGVTPDVLEVWSEISVASGRVAGWTLQNPDAILADICRDLTGPLPFRPVPFDPAWRTPTVLSLAQAIYDLRSFDRLPELADLLEAEGCDSTELLEHLRSPGPHYLGTWSLDAVLGRQ